MKLLRILDDAVVLIPLVQNKSLIPKGIPSKSNSVDDVLSNAPERAQNFFKVPKVVE